MPKSPIPFRGFDERGEVRIYNHGILPHWRQTGCTYFVTFRLADSIPAKVLEEIEYERTLWLKARGINPNHPNWKQQFETLSPTDRRTYEQLVGRLVNMSLDECHGTCVLRNPLAASQVVQALDYFHNNRVFTGDFIVMPNHVHVLMTPCPGHELEEILKSIKQYSANAINKINKTDGALWQRDSYDHIVRDWDQLQAFQEYIRANPLKGKLSASEYVYSPGKYCEGIAP